MSSYKYIFGPVPSRRFGRSLGVDVVPFKTCSFDCIFCQLGRTSNKTLVRREYVPIKNVIRELELWLAEGSEADYITLSGSGEPTLNSKFGAVIDYVHKETNIPVVLLTNGTMFGFKDVRSAASRADIVKVSLSVWSEDSLRHINRPAVNLSFDKIIKGLVSFRNEFCGQLWLEVFLVKGVNTSSADISKIVSVTKLLRAERVQLNTAVRPPAENDVKPLSAAAMERLAVLFHPEAEVISDNKVKSSLKIESNKNDIMAILQRRPCTTEQLTRVLGLHRNEIAKYIGILKERHKVKKEYRNKEIYYSRA